jgi:hypothetical protein
MTTDSEQRISRLEQDNHHLKLVVAELFGLIDDLDPEVVIASLDRIRRRLKTAGVANQKPVLDVIDDHLGGED